MNTPSSLLEEIFVWILQVSWQTAVLVGLVLLAQVIFRNKLSPAWRYALWLLLVIRLVMPFPPQSAFSVFNLGQSLPVRSAANPAVLTPAQVAASPALADQPVVPSPRPEPRLQPEVRASIAGQDAVPTAEHSVASKSQVKGRMNWLPLASWIWLAGVCVLGLRLVWANSVFRLRLSRHAPISEPRICELIRHCAQTLGVKQSVTVIETEAVECPAVCGIWRKWLLLPDGTFERFSDAELRHIFLHEFAHLKRRDLEVNWVVTILQVLHWFNPVLWLAFTRMRADRELATDALALAHSREAEPVAYGETIIKVLEGFTHSGVQPGLVGIAENKARLKERLREIARRGTAKPWRWASIGLAVVLTGVGLTDAPQSTKENEIGQIPALSPSVSSEQSRTTPGSSRPTMRSFTLQVMDYDTGAPLAGVNVDYTLKYFGADLHTRKDNGTISVVTDTDGHAAVQFPSTDLQSLGYRAEGSNHLSLHGEWVEQELPALGNEYQIKLSRGIEIGGSVTDEAGKPIAGAEISFDEPVNMLLSSSQPPFFRLGEVWSVRSGQRLATTDASGNWKARCIWPTVQWVSLRVHHPDFADVTGSTQLTSAMEAEGKGVMLNFGDLKESRVRLKLPKGTRLTGRVLSETGEPVSDVKVNWAELLVSPHSRGQLLGKRTVTTDTAGSFTLEHVPPKHLFFWVQVPGYAPAVAECDSGSTSQIELRLNRGVAVHGELINAQTGIPVAGARIQFADWGIWRGIHWEAVSDDAGRFAWAQAPTERFLLQIEKEGFITQSKIVQVRPNEDLSIRLNRTLHLTGTVVDVMTRQPVRDFRVDWLDRFDAKDFEHGYRVVSVPGSNGVYSLDLGRLYGETWAGGYAHACLFRIRAEGYAPLISRVFSSRSNDVGNVTYDLELTPVSQISGLVLNPGGQPVAGAQVALKLAASRLLLSGKPSLSTTVTGSYQITDAQGRFRLNQDSAAQGLIAVHDEGFAEIKTNEFAAELTMTLQPWGRIEGTVWEYGKLITNQGVWASAAMSAWPESFRMEFRTNSDARGQFAFDFVPPGKFRVYRMIPTERGASGGSAEVVEVQPGKTSRMKLGGEGRPVIGLFKVTNPYVAIDWQRLQYSPYARSIAPRPPPNLSREELAAWREKPEVRRAFENARNYPVKVAADGSFRMDEVLPGDYEMSIQILDPRDPDAFAYSKYIAQATKSFNVSKPAAGVGANASLDIGVFEITLKPDFKAGQSIAPEFEAADLAGGKFKLSDFRGKYVVLDFWATWCGPCIGELPYLKQVQEKFKSRPDFVLVSLSLDKSTDDLQKFLRKNELPWQQGFLGDWAATSVPQAYGVEGIPALFLISPEGKVIESGLDGSSLMTKLQKHLK